MTTWPNTVTRLSPNVPLLVTHHIRRDTDYGLCFYRNQPLRHYLQEESRTEKQSVIAGIPNEEHILVIRADDTASLRRMLPWRRYKLMFVSVWQDLAVYHVYAAE